MKKTLLAFLLTVVSATTVMAQETNPLVGVWQKVVVNHQVLIVTNMGKVYMPDGRMLGYYLAPTDFLAWDNNEFEPWMIATYKVTGEKDYQESISLHQDPSYEGQLNFNFQLIHERVLQTSYQKFMADGLPHTITELWMKKTTDPKEMDAVLKMVAKNYDAYSQAARKAYGR